MKVFVLGTRGIPNIPGGVESHCQQLYPLIVKAGHEVKLSRRKNYVNETLEQWAGISLVDNYSPKKKSLEAIVHTLLAILEAKKWKADIVHFHAIGPAIMIPFARLIGLRVVMTNHGPDYDRDKWGFLAKSMLRLGEKLGGIFANEVIVISDVIRNIVTDRCGRSSHLVYNGVKVPDKARSSSYIKSLGLVAGDYMIAVARFVPEKGLHDLVAAFNLTGLDCKLVLVGDSDHEDDYSRGLKSIANDNPNIVLTGFIIGDPLNQIFSHAKLFVLPSYHEGLPIALLEALSYGIVPLVSDIPANKEVDIDEKYFFQCKNVESLKEKLVELWEADIQLDERKKLIKLVKKQYDWLEISAQTIDVYKKTLLKE